jgi:uncharacterized membrane protein (DUF106 family)
MDEEKPSEENTEPQEKPETHEEDSVSNEEIKDVSLEDSKIDNQEESAESDDSEDKEIINEEKPEDSQDKSVPQVEAKVSEPVEEKKPAEKPLDKKGKEGSFMPIFFIMIISLVIAFAWDKVPVISNSVHSVLDPTAGFLLNWNLTAGMLLIVLTITVLTTIIQKYATDQEALRELKKEQKILQAEMKKYKEHPEKVAELSKKQMQFIPKTFKLTSRAVMFTGIPFILFFRWFNDVFIVMEATTGAPIRFLGFLSWFWFYLIFTMVFSSILRKTFKVV